jgi:hypothetical protein
MEEILSEHLNVWRNKKRSNCEQESGGQKKLFSFENASFVSYVSASSRKKVNFITLFYIVKLIYI